MITIQEALNKVDQNSSALETVRIPALDALNHFTSEDIFASIPIPHFDQSAMDGYAVCGDQNGYKVVGEIQAGDSTEYSINPGEAYRIFTGAMTPEGTTAIVKQEITERKGDQVLLTEHVKPGTSIRRKGEELNVGDLVLAKSTRINAAAIGLLSGLGIEHVNVVKKPKITLIVTGNELTKQGEPLMKGKIYESNSYTLRASLNQLNIEPEVTVVEDNYQATKEAIQLAIANSDMVILTGGISVGDYDFVGQALQENNVQEVFYKVNQKPGKPLFFGKKGNVNIFALPGNPAAVLTCFYMYVLPSINKMTGSDNPFLATQSAIITQDFTNKGSRSQLLKAQINNGKVGIHRGQSSAMLSSFVTANCLLYIDQESTDIKRGDYVEVYLIP